MKGPMYAEMSPRERKNYSHERNCLNKITRSD